MKTETEKTQKRYNRVANFYDFIEIIVERILFKNFRCETTGKLKGNVLEIGVGTGKNLPLLRQQ